MSVSETKNENGNGSIEEEGEEKINIVSNAAFPFCLFNYKPEGINLGQYNETYCDQFQVTQLQSRSIGQYTNMHSLLLFKCNSN